MSIAEKLTAVAENVPKVYEAGKNDGYDIVKTEVEAALSNVYTKQESDALLNVHKKWDESVDLTGDELEGKKTSDYIYLANIAPVNPGGVDTVTFGKTREATGQWFGYVGVQNIPAGRYLLVVDIGVDTDFDTSNILVRDFYYTGNGMQWAGRILGSPINKTENRIICEIDFADDDIKRGFYMDAGDGNNPTIKLTLNDVRLYKTKDISSITNNEETVKSLKNDILSDGVAIRPKDDFKEDYIIIVDSDYSHPRIYSFDDAKSVEISLYIPLENSFATKSDFADLTNIVNSKGLTYEDHIVSEEHVTLEPGCLYYLRGNTEDEVFDWYDQNGNALSDGAGTDLPSFKEALVITSSNNISGYYNNIAIIIGKATLGMPNIKSRAFKINVDAPNFYVKGNATISVWKVKP